MIKGRRKGDITDCLAREQRGAACEISDVPFSRSGFSLLEVILALAILAGAIVVLGEANRLALRNAEIARDMGKAQLLCESKLSEIVTGIVPAEPVENAPFDATTTASIDANEPAWLYTIETAQVDEAGLLSVRVTVTRDVPAGQHPVRFSLVRWLPDPSVSSSTGQSDPNAQSGSSSNSNAASSGDSRGSASQTR